MRLPPLTVRPDATNEAEPGVNWMPKWWLSDPPPGSASISSTSVPVDAHWAARCMAVVDAPGEPFALKTVSTAFPSDSRESVFVHVLSGSWSRGPAVVENRREVGERVINGRRSTWRPVQVDQLLS